MEIEQTTGCCPAPGQAAVRTWLPSSTRAYQTSRFHGEGVRYKAKLIGVDPVPDALGEKMCWDSMMKLKGCEAAARSQGKHKQKVWLKVSFSGLKIVDERTGAVIYDHDRSRISSLRKDHSDPRALAYIYEHQDTYSLFYIKTANLADPVLADIEEVCHYQESMQEPAEAPTQTSSLLLLDNTSAPPAEGTVLEDVFIPRPSSEEPNQVSSTNQLMEVFSIPMSPESSSLSQPESPMPSLSNSQILSMFPKPPVGGSPHDSPLYSPTAMSWGQQGLLGNPWAAPGAAPWPAMPVSIPAWTPAGGQFEAHVPQQAVFNGPNTPASPTAANRDPTPLNPFCAPTGTTGPLQMLSNPLEGNLLQ